MSAVKDYALDYVRCHLERGWAADVLAQQQGGGVSKDENGVSRWYTVGIGYIWGDPVGDSRAIKVRRGQIGIAFYYPDGRAEHGVFGIAELADELVKPKQLSLFEVLP